MLIDDLKVIVSAGRTANKPLEYIKIELKEALILRTLDFIYNSPQYSKLIFTGGTALKFIGKTNRLSEDLDLDYNGQAVDLKVMAEKLKMYFSNQGFINLDYTIRSENKVLTIKFPVLVQLGLAVNPKNESDFLYLKIELEKNQYKAFDLATLPVMDQNLFFVINHYDLPSLFANKIGAILGRRGKIFNGKYDFKGRDFYDLIWFLENQIKPNYKRVKEILKKEQNIEIRSQSDIWRLLQQRVKKIDTGGIYADMQNLTRSNESAKALADNYLSIYLELVKKIQ